MVFESGASASFGEIRATIGTGVRAYTHTYTQRERTHARVFHPAWYNNRGRRAELWLATSSVSLLVSVVLSRSLRIVGVREGCEFAMQSVEASHSVRQAACPAAYSKPTRTTIRDTFENISSSILNTFVFLSPSFSLKLVRNYRRLPVGSSVRHVPLETRRFIDRSRSLARRVIHLEFSLDTDTGKPCETRQDVQEIHSGVYIRACRRFVLPHEPHQGHTQVR